MMNNELITCIGIALFTLTCLIWLASSRYHHHTMTETTTREPRRFEYHTTMPTPEQVADNELVYTAVQRMEPEGKVLRAVNGAELRRRFSYYPFWIRLLREDGTPDHEYEPPPKETWHGTTAAVRR